MSKATKRTTNSVASGKKENKPTNQPTDQVESKLILTDKNLLKYEINNPRVLKDLRRVFDELLLPSMFTIATMQEIARTIRESIIYTNEYIVLVATHPLFNINYEEGSILIVEYNNIYIFCYKPKSLDLTLPKILPSFSKLKIPDIKTSAEKIITLRSHCFDQEEYIKYFIASVALIAQGNNNFEEQLISSLRDALVLSTSKSFWHIFIAEKIAFEQDSMMQTTNSSLIHLQLPSKKQLIAFSKQSQRPSYFQYLSFSCTSLLLIAMLFIALFLLVGCKEVEASRLLSFQQAQQQKINQEKEEFLFFEEIDKANNTNNDFQGSKVPNATSVSSRGKQLVEGMCYLKQEIWILVFICIVGYSLVSMVLKKMKSKQSLKK